MTTAEAARRHGRAFDAVAAQYDRNRPGYPDELIDRACATARLQTGSRVLEVGCGTGQLTRSLLARGLSVTAIEPGGNLLSVAERNLAGRGRVDFVNTSFEDAPLSAAGFSAVFSAAAFHWVDPAVSWRRAAGALAPGGRLCLVQHCGLRDAHGRDDQAALLCALRRVAPEIAAGWPAYRDLAATVAGAERRRANVSEVWSWIGSHALVRPEAGRLFDDVQVAAVPVPLEQTADELNRLMGTLSFHARLSARQRHALKSEHHALEQRLGRPIRSSTAAVLVTARRTGAGEATQEAGISRSFS